MLEKNIFFDHNLVPTFPPSEQLDVPEVLTTSLTDTSSGEKIVAASMAFGFSWIYSYMQDETNQVSFPFQFRFIIQRQANQHRQIYIGNISAYDQETHQEKGKNLSLFLTQSMQEAVNRGSQLLAETHIDKNLLFPELMIYEINNQSQVDLKAPIETIHVDKQNLSLASTEWHGSENELFIHYMQNQHVSPHMIQALLINGNVERDARRIIWAQIGKEKIESSFSGQHLKTGQTVYGVVSINQHYSWLDVYDKETNNWIGTRRIVFKDELEPATTQDGAERKRTLIPWNGQALQALSDWGNNKIELEATEILPEAEIQIGNNYGIISFGCQESMTTLTLNKNLYRQYDTIHIKAKTDGITYWYEVTNLTRKTDTKQIIQTKMPIFPAELKSINGPWIGPEKQKYVYYIENKEIKGKVLYISDLNEFKYEVRSSGNRSRIDFFNALGKSIRYESKKLLNIQMVIVTPYQSSNNSLGFILRKDTKEGEYITSIFFDPEKNQFIEEKPERQQELQILPAVRAQELFQKLFSGEQAIETLQDELRVPKFEIYKYLQELYEQKLITVTQSDYEQIFKLTNLGEQHLDFLTSHIASLISLNPQGITYNEIIKALIDLTSKEFIDKAIKTNLASNYIYETQKQKDQIFIPFKQTLINEGGVFEFKLIARTTVVDPQIVALGKTEIRQLGEIDGEIHDFLEEHKVIKIQLMKREQDNYWLLVIGNGKLSDLEKQIQFPKLNQAYQLLTSKPLIEPKPKIIKRPYTKYDQ